MTYELIQATNISSTVSSVTFSGIPQTYSDLLIKTISRTGTLAFDRFVVYINGVNTGSSYLTTGFWGDSSTNNGQAIVFANYNYQSFVYAQQSGTTNSNLYAYGEFYYPQYSGSTFHKIARGETASTNLAAPAYNATSSAYFAQTPAITSIEFTGTGAGGILAGSSFYLYGIKNS